MNADGTCHAGDLFERGTEYVVLYSAEELVRIVNAEKAEAWAEGALWAAVECGAIPHESVPWLAPGDNPYRSPPADSP